VRALVLGDRINEAVLLCDRHKKTPVAAIVREGLLRAHQPEPMIEHGLEIAVSQEGDRIRARTGFLATIANVATLLGLFGTIAGLIQSFEAVGNANAQARSALLAAGISTAMNATMLGLGVAIPCMLAYSFLMNRTNRLAAELGRAAVRTVDLLKQRYFLPELQALHLAGMAPQPTAPLHPQMQPPMAIQPQMHAAVPTYPVPPVPPQFQMPHPGGV
jgi:biopolymer transport protein ExbB/TolQ